MIPQSRNPNVQKVNKRYPAESAVAPHGSVSMRPHPFYSSEVSRRMRDPSQMFDTSSFVTPKGRGMLLLSALFITALGVGLMLDDVITPLYGLAFVPMYLMLVFLSTDVISRKAPYESHAAFLSGRQNTTRAALESLVRMYHWALWTVVLVLCPLYLSGLPTVPATSFLALFTLWIVSVIVAQVGGPLTYMRPMTIAAMADYLTNLPTSQFPSVPDIEAPSDNGVTSPEDDADGVFDQKLGTTRSMSVNESLRGSPARAMDDGLIESDYGDHELPVRRDDPEPKHARVLRRPAHDDDLAYESDVSEQRLVEDLVGTS